MGKRTWRRAEDALLEQMVGYNAHWEAIAAAIPGHTLSACRNRINVLRVKQREAALLERSVAPEPLRSHPPRQPTKPSPSVDHVISTSTAKFVMDAELRARIGRLGITAGLLGDPEPGRSALDKQRAGVVDEPERLDRRSAQFAPKPTLAERVLT